MFTTARLNAWLTESWPHGAIESVGSTRIGEDYGFGGHVYRLDVETANGSRSLVAKRETPDEVSRVVDAYRQMGEGLSRRVPALYGWADEVTLFELIAPATQGDELDFEPGQVEALIQLLADLHAAHVVVCAGKMVHRALGRRPLAGSIGSGRRAISRPDDRPAPGSVGSSPR